MVQVWKYIHKESIMDPQTFTLVGTDRLQHNQNTRHTTKPLNIIQPYANLDIRKHFFTVRVAKPWNNLPAEVQSAKDITTFKTDYDKLMKRFKGK